MASVDVKAVDGSSKGSVELDESIFGVQPNVPVMHQVVTAQLAAKRSGTQSTLTRAEVRGGGAKPWKQKGTGRARQGSTRAPHWAGGGVALGPKPRKYDQKTPKKMVQLALRGALSDRAADGKVVVVDAWDFEAPKTKDAKAALAAIGVEGKVLLVVSRDQEVVWKAFRNIPSVHVCLDSELNAYDVLVSDWVVFSRTTLPTAPATGKAVPVAEPKAAPASAPAAEAEAEAPASDDTSSSTEEQA